MKAALFIPLLNASLQQQPWLSRRLQSFAGHLIELQVWRWRLQLLLLSDGGCAVVEGGQPHTTLTFDADRLPYLLRGKAAWPSALRASGNMDLAMTFGAVMMSLEWDPLVFFPRVLQKLAAPLASYSRDWQKARSSANHRVAAAAVAYARDEVHLLASTDGLRVWMDEVDALRDATECIAQRIARLEF